MLGTSHIAVGVTGLVVIETVAHGFGVQLVDTIQVGALNIPEGIFLVGATAFGSVLPDIDHEHAYLAQRRVGKGALSFRPLQLIAALVNQVFGHRGATHSLAATALMGALVTIPLAVFFGLPFLGLAFTWGYFSHLLADCMTRAGVKFFLPLSTRSYGPPIRFSTGTPYEYLVVTAIITLAAVIVLLIVGEHGLPAAVWPRGGQG